MKLLYGTSNPAKLSAMKQRLAKLDIEVIGLNDLKEEGITIPEVPEEVQPGVHVRTINGKSLSDEQMIEYYAGLVKQYGNLTAKYKNAICFVMDKEHIYEAMEPSMESEKFILTDIPHSMVRKKGFPLDSMSIDRKTNKYYYDLPAERLEQVAVEDGFLMFFQKVLNSN